MRQLIRLIPLLLCASCINFNEPPQTHYYLLESATEQNQVVSDNCATINIRLSAFPELLERNQMVLKDQTNMVRILTYERWADPLNDNIGSVIRDNLQQQFPNALISAGPWDQSDNPDVQIAIQIKRFIGKPGAETEVEIDWQYSLSSKEVQGGRFSDKQPCGNSIQEMVGALNSSLNRFSRQLALELKQ